MVSPQKVVAMKDRTIQVLLVAVIALGVLIGVLELRGWQQMKRRRTQSVAFAINPSSIQVLSFSGTNSLVQCKRENGVWLVGDPQKGLGQADSAKVNQRIEYINSLKKERVITAEKIKSRQIDPSEYGFSSPFVQIEVTDAQQHRRWQVGRKTPDGNQVYVRSVEDESGRSEIFTVSSKLLDYVPLKPEELRSRMLFPWKPEEVRRVELRRTSGFVRVVKGAEGGWSIQQPIQVLADPGEFLEYLKTLCQLRIETFEAENVPDLSVYGLQEEGSRQISLAGPGDVARTLVVGDPVSGKPGYVYACRKDDTSVFTMQESVLNLLNEKVDRLRDARVVSIPSDKITSVRITSVVAQRCWISRSPARGE